MVTHLPRKRIRSFLSVVVFLQLVTVEPEVCSSTPIGIHADIDRQPHADHYNNDLWLEDFETQHKKDLEDSMQSDLPFNENNLASLHQPVNTGHTEQSSCPPPPRNKPDFSCHVTKCDSDKACDVRGMKCCHNGCRYTCMTPVHPAPYVDWVHEPQRRFPSGKSWLVPGPLEEPQVQWCSTSDLDAEDNEPILCPHGFMCHIDRPSNMRRGHINSGRCVREPGITEPAGNVASTSDDVSNTKTCVIGDDVYTNGATLIYGKHTCMCHAGAVLCKVGHQAKSV